MIHTKKIKMPRPTNKPGGESIGLSFRHSLCSVRRFKNINMLKCGFEKTKNRPWAVTTLLHIALILFGFLYFRKWCPGRDLNPHSHKAEGF